MYGVEACVLKYCDNLRNSLSAALWRGEDRKFAAMFTAAGAAATSAVVSMFLKLEFALTNSGLLQFTLFILIILR